MKEIIKPEENTVYVIQEIAGTRVGRPKINIIGATRYGTLKFLVHEETMEGNHVLLDIDVKGALELKKMYSDTILIFIKPPSLDELKRRLIQRGSETQDQIELRLSRIELEYEKAKEFDYIIINDTLDDAILEIEKVVDFKK